MTLFFFHTSPPSLPFSSYFLSYPQSNSGDYPKRNALSLTLDPSCLSKRFVLRPVSASLLHALMLIPFSALFVPCTSTFRSLCCLFPSLSMPKSKSLSPGSYSPSLCECTVQYSVLPHQADCFLSGASAGPVTSKHLSIPLL